MQYLNELLNINHVIGYRNNTFAPDRFITPDEFMIMCTNPKIFRSRKAMSYKDMTILAKVFAEKNNFMVYEMNGNALLEIAMKHNLNIDDKKLKDIKNVKRIDAAELICALSKKVG